MDIWGFYMPTRIRFGWGRFREIRQVVDEVNGKRMFLVTRRPFAKEHGVLDKLSDYSRA